MSPRLHRWCLWWGMHTSAPAACSDATGQGWLGEIRWWWSTLCCIISKVMFLKIIAAAGAEQVLGCLLPSARRRLSQRRCPAGGRGGGTLLQNLCYFDKTLVTEAHIKNNIIVSQLRSLKPKTWPLVTVWFSEVQNPPSIRNQPIKKSTRGSGSPPQA